VLAYVIRDVRDEALDRGLGDAMSHHGIAGTASVPNPV
jgi:hypothetical protein